MKSQSLLLSLLCVVHCLENMASLLLGNFVLVLRIVLSYCDNYMEVGYFFIQVLCPIIILVFCNELSLTVRLAFEEGSSVFGEVFHECFVRWG